MLKYELEFILQYQSHTPTHSSASPHLTHFIMPLQSQIMLLNAADATALHIHPSLAYASIVNNIIQTSILSLSLDVYDIHGAGDHCALDLEVATSLYSLNKRTARAIMQAVYPRDDVRAIYPFIPSERLAEIGMDQPHIIAILSCWQNPYLITGTARHIRNEFQRAQQDGIDGLKWLLHARARCAIYPNHWEWTHPLHETFPSLEYAMHRDYPYAPVQQNIELPPVEDRNRALILHPIHATTAQSSVMLHPTMSSVARSAVNPYNPPYDPTYPHFSTAFATSTACTPPSSPTYSASSSYSSSSAPSTPNDNAMDSDVLMHELYTFVDDQGREVIDLTIDGDVVMKGDDE